MDLWDWLRGLKRWWWIVVIFPGIALVLSWILSPAPQYTTSWQVNVVFDEPSLSSAPTYFDFVFLDDLDQLVKSGALGDVMYLKLPETLRAELSRDEFGEMVHSDRRAREVEITISGSDSEAVKIVASTIDANLEDVMNQYLVPADYAKGPGVINTLNPTTEPTLDSRTRLKNVGAITLATAIVSVAATGIAEWTRLSYRAKNSAR